MISAMGGSERFEQLIAFMGSHLPQPIEQEPAGDGSVLFTGGDPSEVVIHLTNTSIVVSEFAVEWETSHSFIVKPRRVGMLKWRRLGETALMNALAALIKGAREARLARYRACRYCGESTPPEWLQDDDVCQECAEQRFGVVH